MTPDPLAPLSRDDYAQTYREGETAHPVGLCQCGWCDRLCSGEWRDEEGDAQCTRCAEIAGRQAA
jgi:hypothetical protein